MRRLVGIAAASAAVAALVVPGLAPGQGSAPKLDGVAQLGLPGSRVPAPAPGTAGAHDRRRERHRERRARLRARGRASRWRGDGRAPPDRRLEQHEGRPDPGRDGRGACVPEGAEAEHAGIRRGLRPGRDRARRLHDRRGRSWPQPSRRRPRRPRAPISTTRSSRRPSPSRIRGSGARRSCCSRTGPTSAARQASPRRRRRSPRPTRACTRSGFALRSTPRTPSRACPVGAAGATRKPRSPPSLRRSSPRSARIWPPSTR